MTEINYGQFSWKGLIEEQEHSIKQLLLLYIIINSK